MAVSSQNAEKWQINGRKMGAKENISNTKGKH